MTPFGSQQLGVSHWASIHTQTDTLHFNGHFPRWTWVSRMPP